MSNDRLSSSDSSSSWGDIEPVRARRPLGDCLPPPSVSESQALLELLEGKLESGADKITLSRDQVLDIVQQLRGPGESKASGGSSDPKLTQVEQDFKRLRAHIRLGDYAGKVYNDLKDTAYRGTRVSINALTLAKGLREEANGRPGKVTETLQKAVVKLPLNLQFQDKMPMEVAKFAIYAYEARNLACHRYLVELKSGDECGELAAEVSRDLKELPDFLPDDQIQHLESWRRIIDYYRDSWMRHDPKAHTWTWFDTRKKDSGPSEPTDVTTLPKDLRQQPFDSGQFLALMDPGADDVYLGPRRGSEPIPFGKRKRGEEFLEGEPRAKVPRREDPKPGSLMAKDKSTEEYEKALKAFF
ncbi:MAG: hypothetical protein Q9224_003574, partial [Gallowayella concinna]